MTVIIIALISAAFLSLVRSYHNKHFIVLSADVLNLAVTTLCLMVVLSKFSQYRYYFRLDFLVYSWLARVHLNLYTIKSIFNVSFAFYLFLHYFLAIDLLQLKSKNKTVALTTLFVLVLFYVFVNSKEVGESLYIKGLKNPYGKYGYIETLIVCYNYMLFIGSFLLPLFACVHSMAKSKIRFVRVYISTIIAYVVFISAIEYILIQLTSLKYYFCNNNVQQYEIMYKVYNKKLFIYFPVAIVLCSSILTMAFFKYKVFNVVNIFYRRMRRNSENLILYDINHILHTCKNSLMTTFVLQEKIMASKTIEECKNTAENAKNKIEVIAKHIEECTSSYNNKIMKFESMGVISAIEKAIAMLNTEKGTVKIERDYGECFNDNINGNESNLTEMFLNILKNSIEAFGTRTDGEIKITVNNAVNWVCISIRDNGDGINKKALKKVFNPLYSSKRTTNNWGMGLYQAKCVTEAHFGLIDIQSKVKEFTEIQIVFPLAKQEVWKRG